MGLCGSSSAPPLPSGGLADRGRADSAGKGCGLGPWQLRCRYSRSCLELPGPVATSVPLFPFVPSASRPRCPHSLPNACPFRLSALLSSFLSAVSISFSAPSAFPSFPSFSLSLPVFPFFFISFVFQFVFFFFFFLISLSVFLKNFFFFLFLFGLVLFFFLSL